MPVVKTRNLRPREEKRRVQAHSWAGVGLRPEPLERELPEGEVRGP